MEYLKRFFDYDGLYKDTRNNTIGQYKTIEEFVEFIDSVGYDVEKAKVLYVFLTDDDHAGFFIRKMELCEDSNYLDFNDEIIEITYNEDTSEHNEGGSHPGGYEYIFKIDLELEIMLGLEIINHN